MAHPLDRIRGHVYPRPRLAAAPGGLHASDIILGMLGIMLAVLVVASAVTLTAGLEPGRPKTGIPIKFLYLCPPARLEPLCSLAAYSACGMQDHSSRSQRA